MNKHKVPRDIPPGVQRKVRQRCYFACVVCGRLPYHYDHFAPEFAEATAHLAEGITLLCPICHQNKSSGRLSNEEVARHNAKPFCRTNDAVWTHRVGDEPITLKFAGTILAKGEDVGVLLRGKPILGLRKSDEGRWELTGSLRDPSGRHTITFENDQVIVSRGSWDVTFEGTKLTVRSGLGEIVAEMVFDAESRTVELTRLSMVHDKTKLTGSSKGLQIDTDAVKDFHLIGGQNIGGITVGEGGGIRIVGPGGRTK